MNYSSRPKTFKSILSTLEHSSNIFNSSNLKFYLLYFLDKSNKHFSKYVLQYPRHDPSSNGYSKSKRFLDGPKFGHAKFDATGLHTVHQSIYEFVSKLKKISGRFNPMFAYFSECQRVR